LSIDSEYLPYKSLKLGPLECTLAIEKVLSTITFIEPKGYEDAYLANRNLF